MPNLHLTFRVSIVTPYPQGRGYRSLRPHPPTLGASSAEVGTVELYDSIDGLTEKVPIGVAFQDPNPSLQLYQKSTKHSTVPTYGVRHERRYYGRVKARINMTPENR